MKRVTVLAVAAAATLFFAIAAGAQLVVFPEETAGMQAVHTSTVLLYGFVGVTSFLSRPSDGRVRIFLSACLAIAGTWLFFPFPPVVPSSVLQGLYVAFHTGVFFVTSALLFHIAALLPERSPLVRRYPEIIRTPYEVTALLVGVVTFAYVNARCRWVEWLPSNASSLAPIVRKIVLGFYGLSALSGSFLVVQAGVHSQAVASRRQAVALFSVLFPFGLLRLLGAVHPPFMGVVGYPVVETVALLLIPLGLFLAVHGFHLFELRVHLRRGVLFALTSAVVICAGYAVTATAAVLVPSASLPGVILAFVAVGVVLYPLLRSIGVVVDTTFFPERLVARRFTGVLLERVAEHTDVRVLSAVLANAVVESLAVESAAVYVVDHEDAFFDLAGSAGACDGVVDRFAVADAKAAIAPASTDAREPWNGWRYVFPITFRDRLNAVLTVGAKRSGDTLSRDEARELGAASLQIAAMIENARLFALATRDALTGLFRRPVFEEHLEREAERFRRGGPVFSVVMVDIDNFKKVNDTFGHPMGDRVLRAVSSAIRSHTRESDVVARYGGEEIILLLPATDQEGARTMAEKVRAAVAGVVVAGAKDGLRATVSLGVAAMQAGREPSQLVALADEALYRAKRGGKNRVEVAVETVGGGEWISNAS